MALLTERKLKGLHRYATGKSDQRLKTTLYINSNGILCFEPFGEGIMLEDGDICSTLTYREIQDMTEDTYAEAITSLQKTNAVKPSLSVDLTHCVNNR